MSIDRKPDPRSIMPSLPAEQRELIDQWLFKKNYSYARIMKQCQEKWELELSEPTLSRYYNSIAKENNLKDIAESAAFALAVEKKFKQDPTDYYRLLDKMIGQIAFNLAADPKKRILQNRAIQGFVKLMLDGKKYSLARQKWEFDAARACREHLPEIQGIQADTSLDDDDKLDRIRLRLFGCAPK